MLLHNFKFAFKTRKAWWFTATSRSRARFARTTLGSFWLGFGSHVGTENRYNLKKIRSLTKYQKQGFRVDCLSKIKVPGFQNLLKIDEKKRCEN